MNFGDSSMLYNFVIVDDNEYFLNFMERIIQETIIDNNHECKINKFNDYNEDFFNTVHKYMENRILILDIETPSDNGIQVAAKIREFDNESIIIFVSAYENDYLRAILKSDTNYFCTLTKDNLSYDLKIKLEKIFNNNENKKKILNFRFKDTLYTVLDSDIIYIKYEDRKCHIITHNNTIKTNQTLGEIYDMLPNNFVYSHKACIVNMLKVIDYSLIVKEINFENNIKTDLISRKYIENLDNFYKSNK